MDEDENVTTEQALKAEIAALTHENRELELENRGLHLQVAAGSTKPVVYPADMQDGKRYRITFDGSHHGVFVVNSAARETLILERKDLILATHIEEIQ